ncbi:MAG: Fic family protein, partial [Propionibacteriaceae bacterium]|nr:Fic family protein [Propionibacteriaceae bacterium]
MTVGPDKSSLDNPTADDLGRLDRETLSNGLPGDAPPSDAGPGIPVEPAGSDPQVWLPRDDFFSRHRSFAPRPYRSAVMPRIAEAAFPLPAGLAAAVEDSTAALVRLDAHLATRFGDQEIVPLATVLLRSESASSSQIERLTVGARRLAIAELGRPAGGNAELVARNVASMRRALELADRLDETAILAAHQTLMGDRLDDAGRYRAGPVWIGGLGSDPSTAAHVPPAADRVPESMADLMAFARRDDLPVLLQAAVAHAQFENIHPFADGNGRVGRALLQAMLRHHGVTRSVTIPLSAGLLVDTAAYFDALSAYRRGDAAPIVSAVARAAWIAAAQGRRLVDALADLLGRWED